MKKLKIYSILLLFPFGMVFLGCVAEDDLDVSEFNTISADNLEPEAVVIAAYSALDYRYNTGDFRDLWPFDHAPSNWATSDIRSGDAYKGGGGTGDNPGGGMHQLEIHDVFPASENVYNLWRSIYFGLKRVDTAIRLLVSLEDGEFANRDIRLGELYTLRAHFYFEAMKNFGSIVWYDENTPVTDFNTIPNTFDEAFIWERTFFFEKGLDLQYKITRGSWESEGLNDQGKIPDNYELLVQSDTTVIVKVPLWKDTKE
jgi:hypothetical protein